MLHIFNIVWHFIEVKTGTVNEPGPFYGFWSGFGSDLTEFVSFVTAVYMIYRHTNCHVAKCPRISKHEYEMDGAKYKLCKVHHPAVDENKKLTADVFRRHHAKKTNAAT